MRLLFASLLALASGACAGPAFIETVRADAFLKGNLHTHTLESDGDAPVGEVLAWYKAHGYAFVAITDHNKLVGTSTYAAAGFLPLPGDELSSRAWVGETRLSLHVNALCGTAPATGVEARLPAAAVLQQTIDRAKTGGALVLLNHPNFGWAVSTGDLLAVGGFELLEIASGHPGVNERGDAAHPGEEELWDLYLTRRGRVFGAAVDDSHDFRDPAQDRRPGRAWVQAWSPDLSPASVCAALREGRFYASRGSELKRLSVSGREMELDVAGWDPASDKVEFIGSGGRVLETTSAGPARYRVRGGEGYVRAHVVQAGGREAWTQAYFLR